MIGGQEIEKQSGRYMEIASELTQKPGSRPMNEVNKFDCISQSQLVKQTGGIQGKTVLNVPLSFYFTKRTSAALRSVALAFHEVEFRVKLSDLNALAIGGTASGSKKWSDCKVELITGAVYLDAKERESVARSCVEQVVTMVSAHRPVEERTGVAWPAVQSDLTIDNLPFNHPTRMLVVAVGNTDRTGDSVAHQPTEVDVCLADGTKDSIPFNPFMADGRPGCGFLQNNEFEYRTCTSFSGTAGKATQHSLENIQLKLNNHERLSSTINASFYNTSAPMMVGYKPRNGIYVVPFSLDVRAETGGAALGSLNLSRIDRTSMEFKCSDTTLAKELYLYSDFYNVLSVRNGMAGLRFSS